LALWSQSRFCCYRLSDQADGGGKRTSGKKGKSGDALNKLLKYLLPIAGKRILLLLGLAIVRTAFSNRLARMQVFQSSGKDHTYTQGIILVLAAWCSCSA